MSDFQKEPFKTPEETLKEIIKISKEDALRTEELIKISEEICAQDSSDAEIVSPEVKHVQKKQIEEIRRLKAENDKLEQDNEGRKNLRDSIFAVTVVWMFLVLVIVWHVGNGELKLSDSVLITLITTTTANVFGFLYIVVKYLFNETKST